jgi:hypothetical protein
LFRHALDIVWIAYSQSFAALAIATPIPQNCATTSNQVARAAGRQR